MKRIVWGILCMVHIGVPLYAYHVPQDGLLQVIQDIINQDDVQEKVLAEVQRECIDQSVDGIVE